MSGDSVWITNVIRYHICIAVFLARFFLAFFWTWFSGTRRPGPIR